MTDKQRQEDEPFTGDPEQGDGTSPRLVEQPTICLPAGGNLVPLRVVPEARRNAIPEREYGFETPPSPVPDSDIKETVNTEVVVVGAGISGIAAALAAAEAGAGVVIIEKMAAFQSRGSDNGFVGSRLQKKLGVEIDKDEIVLALMRYGVNKPDQRLLRLWADKSGETADWVMDMTDAAGIDVVISCYPPPADYNPSTENNPAYLTAHIFDQRRMVGCLLDNAIKKGATVRYSTRAAQLLRQGKGRVTGVIARNKEGEYVRFNASKGVILCTGDYGYNDEMMAKYCPQAAYLASKLRTSTGDGHQMAMWIGAVMEPMPHAPISHGFAGPAGNGAFLQVNIRGERFHNEDVSAQSYTNAVERQPGRQAWQVFDSRYPEQAAHLGVGHAKITDMTEAFQDCVRRYALQADTIGELAEKMGVPVDAFEATVARYNELARQGKDLDFGKRPDRLFPVDTPPYYAGKGGYELLSVIGGVNVNTLMQPLDADWEVIPGLYVAGNMVGNRLAVDYPLIAPGISHGSALTFGRIAGRNAATLEP